MRLFILATLSTIIMAVPAIAAGPCSGVDMQLTEQRKVDYANLIAQAFDKKLLAIESVGKKLKPSEVKIENFMQAEKWTVVYASVPNSENGYFFFDSSSGTSKFKEVWGGYAQKSEIPEIKKWVLKLGANKIIASCFANTVTH